jgi:c-di-GMP-binding flagellar brake protein YcgR
MGESISMIIGSTLDIHVRGSRSRIKSELIGIEEGKFLIVKLPPIQSKGSILNLLYKGNVIIVRYLIKGTVFGFKTRISQFVHYPAKLVFIEYPKRIETRELRANKRIECYLPANVKINDNTIDGVIVDISKGGCQIVIEKAKVKGSLVLQVDDEIGISFQLPGVKEELTVAGKQKNIKKDGDSVSIGIKFDKWNIEAQERIYGFLATAGV